MKAIVLVTVLFWCTNTDAQINKSSPVFHTVVTTRNITGQHNTSEDSGTTPVLEEHKRSYIDVQVLEKPNNLFVGRCLPQHEELHSENVILNNDGKSHVTAQIKFNIDSPVDIRCVKVLDLKPGSGAYPTFVRGGVGYNYVDIGVRTKYGKGFDFYVQIFGFQLKKAP